MEGGTLAPSGVRNGESQFVPPNKATDQQHQLLARSSLHLLNQNPHFLKIQKLEKHRVKVLSTLPAILHTLRSPEPATCLHPMATGCDCHMEPAPRFP